MPSPSEKPATHLDRQYVYGTLQALPAMRGAELVDGVIRVRLTNLFKETIDAAHALLEGRGIRCPVQFVSANPATDSAADMINALPDLPSAESIDDASDTSTFPRKPAA